MADGDQTPRTPRARYEADLKNDGFSHDPEQAKAVDALQAIYDGLVANRSHKSLFGKTRREPVKGLYLWGGVGRGKTYLMDCFFDALPFEQKTRLHFHRFMQKVHEARKRYANRSDPLKLIAKEWASDRVLCFDEFFVSDVADAMILARLSEELFERGVTLVTTSNVDPDDLYRDGLQRERFLPAIERIKRYCRVMHLADGTDYRLDHIDESATYQTPPGERADAVLAEHFDRLAARQHEAANNVKVLGRKIPIRRRGDNVVWFDFEDLCRSNRSANDYIELAREFSTIMISNVPVFDDNENNAARRFINAVDEFYDRRVKLFCTAAAEPDDLYDGSRLSFEFERTASRLHEMSSTDYLGEPHRA
ncbi:cell division protein ZapE [Salinisphaera aquimarina]|uniref:Cell division protein ZapE n=1 Tax=Salinisphaera aquimarina TaxID=2094031 RepID=A0ABV7EWJ3_9GAMM